MNTKKLFMLLAAVLLSSVSAIAQSGNNEPLKGDVNEDGTVDVADLVNVIKIMKDAGGAVGEKMCYWYAGTNNGNAVTADNFTDVASRIPESEIPETGSVTANGQYVYFVMPETKHVESLTYANGSVVEFTCTDVMGYHIYKTSEMINTTINYTIKQTIYYWYVGETQPTALPTNDSQLATGLDAGWRKIGNTKPSAGTVIFDGTAQDEINIAATKVTQYFAINSDVTIGSYDSFGVDQTSSALTGPTVVNGMNIYTSVGKSKTFGQIIKVK